MKSLGVKVAVCACAFVLAVSAVAQIYRYYSPGSVWTVTAIRIKAGMDPAYLQYLDSQLKKESETMMKAGYMKSYKILRTFDDDAASWNMLILREYKSLAAMEADEEKADAVARDAMGMNDQKQMQGYEDRSKVREVLFTRVTRELVLK